MYYSLFIISRKTFYHYLNFLNFFRLVQAIFWLPGYIEKMEKKVAEEQLKIKMENEKKLMQDTEASNIKNDIKKYIKQNDIDDEKGEAFEEMISEEQTEIETSEYKKNKDD